MNFLFFRAVQKLYSIRDSMRIVSNARGRDLALHQLPFFFLTTKMNVGRLEIVPNGGIGHGNRPRGSRRVLRGTKSPHEMRILYSLPQGKEITLRPFGEHHPFLLKANREYEFNLGMNKQDILLKTNLEIWFQGLLLEVHLRTI